MVILNMVSVPKFVLWPLNVTFYETALFDQLDAPVQRVTAWDIPLPYARNLEAGALPQVEHIIKAVKKTL